MQWTIYYFDNGLTVVEYLFNIIHNFIVFLNMLQKKEVFETFSSFHCYNKAF